MAHLALGNICRSLSMGIAGPSDVASSIYGVDARSPPLESNYDANYSYRSILGRDFTGSHNPAIDRQGPYAPEIRPNQ